MSELIYTNSLYTPAILELERTADFVAEMATEWHGIPTPDCCKELVLVISRAIRDRAEKLRQTEVDVNAGRIPNE